MNTELDFNQLKVVSFESRMALPSVKMIEKLGGIAISAPTLKEVPLEKVDHIFDIYEKIKNGKIDYLVFFTGVATRGFLKVLTQKFDKQEVINTLNQNTKIVIRGPKPEAVCKMNQINIDFIAEAPNTWREIIDCLNSEDLNQKQIAILEYGISNQDFINSLENLGSTIIKVPIYKWALPDDLEPLKKAILQIINHDIDLALFTSASQVDHLIQVARDIGKELELRKGFYQTAIFSIGPVASEKLRYHQLFADYEVEDHKLEVLINDMATYGQKILTEKRKRYDRSEIYVENNQVSSAHYQDSLFMRALRKEKVERPPIWLMRQAGRYMAEYQCSRRGKEFLEVCKNPELCTEITLTAVERLRLDAAIIFSDILPILEVMGINLHYAEGHGPVLRPTLELPSQVGKLKSPDIKNDLSFVFEAISLTRNQLNPNIPLLGFSGAPFTLASYLIEGGGSKNYINTKNFMRNNPSAWQDLMNLLSEAIIEYLKAQFQSGAQAVQLFDSWAGILPVNEYEKFVLPYSKKIIDEVSPIIPVIHFGSFTFDQLPLIKKAGGQAISLDWKLDFIKSWDLLGNDFAIQGNLDPTLLYSSPDYFIPLLNQFLEKVGDRRGFLFNLGHGILPKTPVDHVIQFIEAVKDFYTSAS